MNEAFALASRCIQLAKDKHVPINLNIHFNIPFSNSIASESASDQPSSPSLGSNPGNILEIPKEGKYNEVRLYIKERSRFDGDFKQFIATSSRVEICKQLTRLFGWFVDDKSLGRNLNRHR